MRQASSSAPQGAAATEPDPRNTRAATGPQNAREEQRRPSLTTPSRAAPSPQQQILYRAAKLEGTVAATEPDPCSSRPPLQSRKNQRKKLRRPNPTSATEPTEQQCAQEGVVQNIWFEDQIKFTMTLTIAALHSSRTRGRSRSAVAEVELGRRRSSLGPCALPRLNPFGSRPALPPPSLCRLGPGFAGGRRWRWGGMRFKASRSDCHKANHMPAWTLRAGRSGRFDWGTGGQFCTKSPGMDAVSGFLMFVCCSVLCMILTGRKWTLASLVR